MAQLEIKPTAWMWVRVFAVIAIACAISLLLMYLLTGGGGEVFAARTSLVTFVADASGLTKVSPVRLNGIVIGVVDKLGISNFTDPQKSVRVQMSVKERYLKAIPLDSETSIRADNLVGDKFVLITAGRSPRIVAEDGELPSEPVRQAADNADLILTLQRNLVAIDKLLQEVSSKDSKFGKLLLTDDYYKTLLSRVVALNRGIHSVITPDSDLGKAFYTMDVYRKILDPIAKFDEQLASIQRGEGQVGQLFATDRQYEDILKALRDFRALLADANAGNGRLGQILKGDDDYRRIQDLIRSTDAMIASLNAGEGQLGKLLTDPQLYESLNGTLRSMQQLLGDVRSNPRKYLRVKVF